MNIKMKKVNVLALLDALATQTKQRGGSPSVENIEKAHAAVAELIEASRAIQSTLEAMTEWYDGCLYYSQISAPELEEPMQSMADALEAIGVSS